MIFSVINSQVHSKQLIFSCSAFRNMKSACRTLGTFENRVLISHSDTNNIMCSTRVCHLNDILVILNIEVYPIARNCTSNQLLVENDVN